MTERQIAEIVSRKERSDQFRYMREGREFWLPGLQSHYPECTEPEPVAGAKCPTKASADR